MQNMDPAALQAQMAQAQAMMSGMSPDQLRSQFSMVLRPSRSLLPAPACRARLCTGGGAGGRCVATSCAPHRPCEGKASAGGVPADAEGGRAAVSVPLVLLGGCCTERSVRHLVLQRRFRDACPLL